MNYPKIITVLAVIFGVSLGLCGLTAFLSSQNRFGGAGGLIIGMGMLELAAIVLSAIGLVIMTFLWVLDSIFGKRRQKDEIQKLFDDSDDGQH